MEKEEGTDEGCFYLSPEDSLARSPPFSPLRDKLVFLSNEKGFDTHGDCMGLSIMDWNESEIFSKRNMLLVDVVGTPKVDKEGKMLFPGLFVDRLPIQCFSPNNMHTYLTCQHDSATKILKISLEDGSVEQIHVNNDDGNK